MNNQIYTNKTSDVSLSNPATFLQQEMTFLIAARTQPAKGHDHTQKNLLDVLIGVDFVVFVLHYGKWKWIQNFKTKFHWN